MIADILQARGQLDEALKIRNEEELPVYERLGDARERAVTMGRIADILQARGQLDEALKIRNEEELPVYERLGDVRSRAVTMGKIADILQARGQLDETLKIRNEEQLPVYERLGDVRSRAVTMGKIADDFAGARANSTTRLRIRREEELPVLRASGRRTRAPGRTLVSRKRAFSSARRRGSGRGRPAAAPGPRRGAAAEIARGAADRAGYRAGGAERKLNVEPRDWPLTPALSPGAGRGRKTVFLPLGPSAERKRPVKREGEATTVMR